ncbi:tetratricopeptide repeat protein [candidate division WOR-3 bacterium]|uniref:Tetratricopeptide repeat protein n=1 Tax=candidate division WOR-3 bacterium TaxID=2052148 RepID=A0A9D5QBV9_UNCW3|nr:tetratricopeptide repeat protein [candidate division WOR-3 bacterium]MBD3363884.1 tetratricopeptide repeat protein [candidate division WOR-3 bacterium]
MKKAIVITAILLLAGMQVAYGAFAEDYAEAEKAFEKQEYKKAYELYKDIDREAEDQGFAAEVNYRIAACAYQLGNIDEALRLLDEILNKIIPSDSRYAYLAPQVNFSIGLCYYQKGGADDKARAAFEAASIYGGLGVSDYLIGQPGVGPDYEAAREHLRGKLEEAPYPVVRLFLARALLLSRNPDYLSEMRYELGDLADNPNFDELVLFSTAEMQFYSEQYAAAKELFRQFMQEYPKSILLDYAEYYLGCSFYHEKDYRFAVDHFQEIADPNENDPLLAGHANFWLGEAYSKIPLPDSAMFGYDRARSVARNTMVDFYTTYRLYEVYHQEGDLESAEREAQRLETIQVSGGNPNLMQNLANYIRGNIKFQQTRYPEAMAAYNEVWLNKPQFNDTTTVEELMVYEAALGMALLTLNRIGKFKEAMGKPPTYLNDFRSFASEKMRNENEAVNVEWGDDFRAYLLYNWADATYYSSYSNGKLRHRPRREEARELYTRVEENYPGAYISTLATIAKTWYKLESSRFREAAQEFKGIFETTQKLDALVLSAYGYALANYYDGNYELAYQWFLDEEGYKKSLEVATSKENEDIQAGIRYNQIADSLIDNALLWKAQAAERNKWYGDALAVYRKVTDNYPERPAAGNAWQKIVDFYLQAKEVDKAMAATDDLKSLKAKNPRIYKEPYTFALALMFDYMANVARDEAKAEEYAKTLISETGSTEKIEMLYASQAMDLTDVADIDELREVIERLRDYNDRSQYLVEPMYNLGLLLMQDKRFDEAKEVLVSLQNWPDANATRDMMPDIRFQLARAYYEGGSYQDAAAELESWTKTYTKGDDARIDLAPNAFWILGLSYFQQGEIENSPQIRTRHYSDAQRSFEVIKNDYSESEFYAENSKSVDGFIQLCEKETS